MTDQEIIVDSYLCYLQSMEKINILSEQEHLLEAISAEKLVSKTQAQMKQIEKFMNKYKVNVSAINSKAKSIGKSIVPALKKAYKAGKKPEDFSKEFITKISKEINNLLKPLVDEVKKGTLTNKILWALGFCIMISFFNVLFGSIFVLLFDPVVAIIMTALVIAPFIEEAAKTFFIKAGMPWIGTGIVFGLELVQYVIQLIVSGGSLVKSLILRLCSLLMHFSTTFIQKKIIEKGKEKGEDREFIAWTVGVSIHILWNTLALIYNTNLSSWVGIE